MSTFEVRLVAELGEFPIRPEVPAGRQVRVGKEVDRGEPDQTDESATTTAFIAYTDANGEESERVITFRGLEQQDDSVVSILSWCHERQAIRRFRIDRISEMICPESGEVLDPMEHCLALKRGGALKMRDFPLTRVMNIATFMARCDGDYHQLERDYLEDMLGRYFRFFGGDDPAYECALAEAPRLAPGSRDFTRALYYLRTRPNRRELARFVLNACAETMDADGYHHQDEVRWGIEASEILKRTATG